MPEIGDAHASRRNREASWSAADPGTLPDLSKQPWIRVTIVLSPLRVSFRPPMTLADSDGDLSPDGKVFSRGATADAEED